MIPGKVFYDVFDDNLVVTTGRPGPFHNTFDVRDAEIMEFEAAFYDAAIGVRLIHIGEL